MMANKRSFADATKDIKHTEEDEVPSFDDEEEETSLVLLNAKRCCKK